MTAQIDTQSLAVELDSDVGLVRALDGLTLSLRQGETVALVGESGSGKSMTALALMRLLPDTGRIAAGDVKLAEESLLALPEWRMRAMRGGRIGMVFQEPATALNPVMRIGEQIVEAIVTHTPLRGAAARAKALDWLQRVGLPEAERRIDDYPFQLSGGQKQRVMIATALAAEPEFLLADEPTTALDVTRQAQTLDLLQSLQRERGLGLLLITHDLAVVAGRADRVALMYAGQVVEVATAAEFFASPQHPYARALMAALPSVDRRGQPLAAIEGTVPALTQAFAGCRFVDRCPQAMDRCRVQPPELIAGSAGRAVRCWLFDERGGASTGSARTEVAEGKPARPEPVRAEPVEAQRAPPTPLLDVRHLSVRYPLRQGLLRRVTGHAVAVDDVSFTLARGETLALVGESGSGKTTVGKAIVQLLRRRAEVSGELHFEGCDLLALTGDALQQARRQVQLVFQDPFASLDPRMRVGEILHEGLRALCPELNAAQREQRIAHLLDRVGLPRSAVQRYPHEFSGGQRQRIAIARALAVEPQLLVCDEPTSALDVSVQAQVLNLLAELQRELGLALLFITHNLGVVEYLAHRVVVMKAGRVEESGPVWEVLTTPQSPYTKMLLSAVPRLSR
jgi:peptide/nickel transport system ATP-binding protein